VLTIHRLATFIFERYKKIRALHFHANALNFIVADKF